jgi:polyisoprenyl-phosphate glycosyltransferase
MPPTYSLVVPIFNEEAVIPVLLRRIDALIESLDAEAEVIVVDDGSSDTSAIVIEAKARADKRYRLIKLSRNFGHQIAITVGLDYAAGRAVIVMDADLQDPPEVIPALVAAWRDGAEVVRATRRTRADTGLRRAGFDLFHAILGRLSDYPIEPKTGTFGVLGRAAVDAFHQLPERNRFFPGLRAWIGFPTADVPYDRHERAAGKPQQTFRRLVRYALDGVFSFSQLPLRLLTYSGIFVGFAGFCLGLYYVVKRLIKIETAPTGFTTLAALVLFLGGVQLIAIGVLGEYLGRIYDEVKHRPLFLVRRPHSAPDSSAGAKR